MIGKLADDISPEEFELFVKQNLEGYGDKLLEFETEHREVLEGVDGEYEIDVTARFEALGVDFLVLVECKKHKNRIKREVVEILYNRIRSVGAHKGMVFATAEFQSGAIEFAEKHRIALISVVDGKSTYQTRSVGPTPEPPAWFSIPKYVGWLTAPSENGGTRYSNVSPGAPDYLLPEMRRIEDAF